MSSPGPSRTEPSRTDPTGAGPTGVVSTRAEPTDPLALAAATAVWGTAIMLPWLAVELATGAASPPAGWGGLGGLLYLGVVVTAPTIVLFNDGAERLPAAVTGILTAAIPAPGYLFALLLGEPFVLVTALGGVIALVGVAVASTARDGSRRRDATPTGATREA